MKIYEATSSDTNTKPVPKHFTGDHGIIANALKGVAKDATEATPEFKSAPPARKETAPTPKKFQL